MLTHMQVFNKFYMPAIIETFGQKIEQFNEASAGAIVLTKEGFEGDFLQESFFSSLHSAQRRVDRYAANGTPSVTNLAQGKNSAVKIAGGFGPILWEPSQMTWLETPTARSVEVISRNFAEALLADQLNTSIAALVAALSNNAGVTNDVSATLGISYTAMNDTHAKFGDSSQQLIANVMNGTAYHKFIGQNIANTQNLFQAGNVTVTEVLGKRNIVTDAPALYAAGSPNKLRVLALSSGAAVVSDGSDVITNIQTTNGKDRIETTFQADYSFGIKLKGYTWDEANGGKSPTDAEIATGTNWDKTATSNKATAGAILIGDASK